MENTNETYFQANKAGWNLKTAVHETSEFYDLAGWKQGKTSLTPIELAEMGEVAGKKLLHLQCHFGQDTLSWARMGAQVTGCDFSENAIHLAQQLAETENLPAKFVCCNVLELDQHLRGKFDIVFTSYGTIGWLPDLAPWAKIVAHFLKKGGFFYIADFHPVVWMFDDQFTHLKYAYHNTGVIETEQVGSYADRYAELKYREYGWNHALSEVVNALLAEGLRLEFLNEHMASPYACFDKTVPASDGFFQIEGLEGIIPMVFSLKARK